MFLARVEIENFRIFSNKKDGGALDLRLHKGLNVLAGENDSGKTALLDAIRFLMGTQSSDWLRISRDDFHMANGVRANQLHIACEFSDLSVDEASMFLEWLCIEEDNTKLGLTRYVLKVWLDAVLVESSLMDREVRVSIQAGVVGNGTPFEGEPRQVLRPTYLKALRDAAQELAAKKGSRLSQILYAFPPIRSQEKTASNPSTPRNLVSIVKDANREIEAHPSISAAKDTLNKDYLQNFVLGDDQITGTIRIADPNLRRVLEQLQLLLSDDTVSQESTPHGLGVNNLLFMATELVLLRTVGKLVSNPLLLIEEPEAHLHPQSQLRLMEFLGDCQAQVIVTTHSPNIASVVPVDRLIVMNAGMAFPLTKGSTGLDESDYGFLSRFLDVTKANLFFARGVIIVEGPAEQLLIPAIADALGRPLTRYGVSIVCVGHTGLFRYARVFQRKTSSAMPVRVACVSDRDIPPDCAKVHLGPSAKTEHDYGEEGVAQRLASRRKVDGGPVKSYVSPCWTLEYDLALGELRRYVNRAIRLASSTKVGFDPLSKEQVQIMEEADRELEVLVRSGLSDEETALSIYEPLMDDTSKALAAQFLAAIVEREIHKPGMRERIASSVPQYLRDAIYHATGFEPGRKVSPRA